MTNLHTLRPLALATVAMLALTAGTAKAGHDGQAKRYHYGHQAGYAYGHPVSRADVPALLAQHGFVRIYDIDKDDGVYEVEARHANGRKAEIEIDIATGRIIEIDWD